MLRKCFWIGFFWLFALNPFGFMETALAEDAGGPSAKADSKSRRTLTLVGAGSGRLSLPPPCSIVDLRGKNVTLRDFYGRRANVQVEDASGMKVGDKVVVKDGLLITGIFPQ
jgi:hypothetical protein